MKKLINIIILFLLIFYLEVILKIALFDSAVFNINLIYTALFIVPIAIFFNLVTSLFNELINKIISFIILFIITIIFVAQLVYYKTYLSIFSVYSIKNAGQLTDFIDTIIDIIQKNILFVFLLFIPFFIFIIFNKRLYDYKRHSLKALVVMLGCFVGFQILGNVSLLIAKNDSYSAWVLYHDKHSPTLAVNKLGLLTTMRLDIKRIILGFNEKGELNIVPKEKPTEVEKVVTYNIMNIDFDGLIQNESNDTIKKMHEFFKDAPATNQNDYTGMFKGKNLIVFLGESFNSLAIDPDITPTLYKLSHEGFIFNNFYTPLFPVSTTDGEYITATSLIPKEGVWSSYRSSSNYLPFVLGNAFKNLGYKTTAYHNHTATYYNRNEYIPNWGYDFYACKAGLNINCKSWPESDLEMIEASYSSYINNSSFLTYYITVSGHLNYTKSGNMMARKNWSAVQDFQYSEKPKGYLATHVELDKALESLINYLDEAGVLKDTVIAISGDHYPYGLTLDEINEIADPDRDDNFEKHRSSFILWNSDMESITIDKLSSSLDILPTILNLFGVEYDSRLLMGKDIMSDEEPIVIFSNRSFITEEGRYNTINDVFEPNDGVTIDDEYVKNISNIIDTRFYLSRQILDTNYYKKVLTK